MTKDIVRSGKPTTLLFEETKSSKEEMASIVKKIGKDIKGITINMRGTS